MAVNCSVRGNVRVHNVSYKIYKIWVAANIVSQVINLGNALNCTPKVFSVSSVSSVPSVVKSLYVILKGIRLEDLQIETGLANRRGCKRGD